MTLILNQSDCDDLDEQAPITCPGELIVDEYEELSGVPEYLGRGYTRWLELSPGLELKLTDCEYHQDWGLKVSEHEHRLQITLFPVGGIDSTIHPTLGEGRAYFSGSGISPGYIENHSSGRLRCVNVEIEPDWMELLFFAGSQHRSDLVKQLFRGEEWKTAFYPQMTGKVRSLAYQLWNAPYRGAAKRLYLQAKVIELLAMYLDLISEEPTQNSSLPRLKPQTLARLHQAKEILTTQFIQPPSLTELAQQVGLSVRTLQRGFKTLFHTTIVGYVNQRRLERAEQLLRQGNDTVAEVAMQVGYGHLGHFATAFKERFGITPSQCKPGDRVIQVD